MTRSGILDTSKDGASEKNCYILSQSQVEHKGGQARRKYWEQCQITDFQAKQGTELKTRQSVQSRKRTGSQWEMFKK